tara:strand:+ start:1113 stop:2015 length:903 start_codon:yes stop_codon:yes gene_type:complete
MSFTNPNDNTLYSADMTIINDYNNQYYFNNPIVPSTPVNEDGTTEEENKITTAADTLTNENIVFRNYLSNSDISNPTLLMQPETRDDAATYFSISKKVATASSDRLLDLSISNRGDGTGELSIGGSRLIELRRLQAAQAAQEEGISITLGFASGEIDDLSQINLSLTDLNSGKYSYLNMEQTKVGNSQGQSSMNIIPLKEPLESAPQFLGKPVVANESNSTFESNNVSIVSLQPLSNERKHYFPIRDKNVSEYIATDENRDLAITPSYPNSSVYKYYTKKSSHIGNYSNTNTNITNFRLF